MTSVRSLATLVVAVALPLGVGALGAIASLDGVAAWYPNLQRPSFAPPSWVFGPVWTMLYIAMGVASWLVWRQGVERVVVRRALAIYGIQLVFNVAWSWLFFGLRQPLLALVDIGALMLLLVLTTWRFRQVARAAGALMLPYLAWVAFATALNAGFWWLNR